MMLEMMLEMVIFCYYKYGDELIQKTSYNWYFGHCDDIHASVSWEFHVYGESPIAGWLKDVKTY